jgi:exonuclease SbcC
MRLIRLELAGFGAFRSPTELTFDDVDFFALVGPTGSGKSTILDAVCFALYGSVPRYESENLIRYVVSLGASEARVRLDFELGGDRYIATRVARRTAKGVVATKEARLERVTTGDTTEVVAGVEREMSAAVVRLLGLRFDDFTRCVALPQGDFARFLRAKGDERRDLLLRLLNLGVYTEVGATARRLGAEARSQIGLLDGQLAQLAAATPDALETAIARRREIDDLQGAVEEARPVLADLAEKEKAARDRAVEARRWVDRLGAIAVPEAVREFAGRQRQAQATLTAEDGALAELAAGREAAEKERAPLPEMATLQTARTAHEDLARCGAAIAETEVRLQESAAAEQRAQTELDAAEAGVSAVLAERDGLHRRHQALLLAEGLAVGEPCPVCDQVVARLPDRGPDTALEKVGPVAALTDAERAVGDAETARKQRRRDHHEAAKLVAAATEKLAGLTARRKEFTTRVDAHSDRAALDGLIGRVEAAEARLRELQEQENQGRGRVAKARAALLGLEEGAREARNRFSAQRDTVAGLEPPPAALVDVLTDWEALADWAQRSVPAQSEVADAADAEAAGHAAGRAARLAALGAGLERVGIAVTAAADPVAVLSAVVKAAAQAAEAADRIEADIARAGELRETRGRLEEDADVAELLGKLLKADRFPEWLVAEALALLAVDASEILRQLTGGQFSLAVGEKEFVVIDHGNADERRPARTLSGGETFQASLALALALSQQIRNLAAEGAPRLDAIFLDEGFGSLDPDTLDVVAATIENLGQSGRMVGVVTHVRELASRVPVRFEVSKGRGTSVVEKRFA